MAYTSTEYSSRPPPYNQQIGETGVFVVNQQPQSRRQFQFPISFPPGPVLAVSIGKCIIGSLYIIFGIVNIFVIPYFTSYIAFPTWCGLLIAAFCALSITSLILTVIMLVFYSISLNYFTDSRFYYYTCSYYGSCYYIRVISSSTVEASIGLLGFLMLLILIELGCSIAAVVYSCKAYSKCCSTCLINDCCACVGCGECDTRPLNNTNQQLRQQGGQSLQPQNQFSYGQYPQTQQQQQPEQQQLMQQQQATIGVTQGANPCSALLNVIINMPGASYFVDTVRPGQNQGQNDSQAQTVCVTIHPRDGMQPSGSSQPPAEEIQAVNPSAQQINPNFAESSMMGAQKM
eukprot:gene747-10466_t